MDKQQMRFEAAKAAMQALLGSTDRLSELVKGNPHIGLLQDVVAMAAVRQGDALLAELAAKEVE